MDSSTRFSLRDRSCLPCSPYSPGWAGLAWDGAALVITRSQRAAPDGSLVRARRGAQTFSHLRVSARSAGVHFCFDPSLRTRNLTQDSYRNAFDAATWRWSTTPSSYHRDRTTSSCSRGPRRCARARICRPAQAIGECRSDMPRLIARGAKDASELRLATEQQHNSR